MSMNRAIIGCLSAVFALHPGCSSTAHEAKNPKSERIVTGQLLLPDGIGARGVQVIIDIAKDGSTTREWLELNNDLKFQKSFNGTLTKLEIATGLSTIVHRLNAKELARPTQQNSVDVGTIDLRRRLQSHKIKFFSDGASVLRAGMWLEKPKTDFAGSLPSLGSRQFPEIETGNEMDLLLPSEFDAAYFLVEAPADKRRGKEWRSGKQKLFGPFRSSELPAELRLQ